MLKRVKVWKGRFAESYDFFAASILVSAVASLRWSKSGRRVLATGSTSMNLDPFGRMTREQKRPESANQVTEVTPLMTSGAVFQVSIRSAVA